MLEQFKRILIVVGHYGSGKTNLSVNLALGLKEAGKEVALVDLDTVNPYFRSADFETLMGEQGIELIAPTFAGTNLDVPAITGRLDAAINSDKQLIIDVGGDDAGARALGRYSASIAEAGGCDMLYVVNGYRYLTRSSDEAAEVLGEIQMTSRLQVTGVVNCSNLSVETTAADIADTVAYAQETADRYGVPYLFTAVEKRLLDEARGLMPSRALYPVDIYVKKPWEA